MLGKKVNETFEKQAIHRSQSPQLQTEIIAVMSTTSETEPFVGRTVNFTLQYSAFTENSFKIKF